MQQWIVVRMKFGGQVQEMVPHIARQLIASGLAEEIKQGVGHVSISGTPVVETASLIPAQSIAARISTFIRGPRSFARP